MPPDEPIDRRRMVAGTLAAGIALTPAAAFAQKAGVSRRTAAPLPGGAAAAPAVGQGRAFFTDREFRVLDEIAELIIPADAKSGGARAAKIAEHLDRLIGESIDPDWRQSWHDDLAEFDRLAKVMFKKGFLEISSAQRVKLMQRVSRKEDNPKEPGEYAFGTIKWAVGDIFYRTKIGIHDDLGYQGNVIQDAFVGFAPKKT